MSLRTRLSTLERAVEKAELGSTCPECGGPVPGYSMTRYEDPEGNNLNPECSTCGLSVGACGQAMLAARLRPGDTGEPMKIVILPASCRLTPEPPRSGRATPGGKVEPGDDACVTLPLPPPRAGGCGSPLPEPPRRPPIQVP